jgi:hypothetical protein
MVDLLLVGETSAALDHLDRWKCSLNVDCAPCVLPYERQSSACWGWWWILDIAIGL